MKVAVLSVGEPMVPLRAPSFLSQAAVLWLASGRAKRGSGREGLRDHVEEVE